MFSYNKILEYPINIKNPNSRLAVIVATQYGGPCICRLSAAFGRSSVDFL